MKKRVERLVFHTVQGMQIGDLKNEFSPRFIMALGILCKLSHNLDPAWYFPYNEWYGCAKLRYIFRKGTSNDVHCEYEKIGGGNP